MWGLAGTLCVALALIVRCAPVSSQQPRTGQFGCKVSVNEYTQSAYYEPLRIVGEHENLDDWWCVLTSRGSSDYKDIDGTVRAVNIPKVNVLLRGEVRIIKGVRCTCPEWD